MTRDKSRARLLVALSAAAGLFGLAACGGPATTAAPASTTGALPGLIPSGGTGVPAPPNASPPGAAAPAPAAANAVSIQNFAFAPASVTVRVGTTVTWTNLDQDAHTVTARDRTLGSTALNRGDSYRYTFTKAGTYAYLCTIHPFMTGTVVVTP